MLGVLREMKPTPTTLPTNHEFLPQLPLLEDSFLMASGSADTTPRRGSRIQAIKMRLMQQGLQLDAPASTLKPSSPQLPIRKRAGSAHAQTFPRRNSRRRYRGFFESACKPLTLTSLWTDEALVRNVFKHLEDLADVKRCSAVCATWRSVAQKLPLWARQSHAVFNAKMLHNQSQMERFLEMCYLRNVTHIDWLHVDDATIKEASWVQYVQHVEEVRFVSCNFSEPMFRQVLENFSAVSGVEFHGCNSLSEAVLGSSMPPKVKRLFMVDCMRLTNECLTAVLQASGKCLSQLQLQSYHLSDKMATCFERQPSEELRQLSLLHCLQVGPAGLASLVHLLPRLTHLELSGCSQVCDDTLDAISSNLTGLEVLECAWCPSVSDVGLECLAGSTRTLRRLVLDRCSGITDVGLESLCSLPLLQSLSLRWCPGVNDVVLLHCLRMVRLQELCITGCHRVSRNGLEALLQHENLRHLELRNNALPAVDEVVASFATHLPQCVLYL